MKADGRQGRASARSQVADSRQKAVEFLRETANCKKPLFSEFFRGRWVKISENLGLIQNASKNPSNGTMQYIDFCDFCTFHSP
jgi:hypothetical protein